MAYIYRIGQSCKLSLKEPGGSPEQMWRSAGGGQQRARRLAYRGDVGGGGSGLMITEVTGMICKGSGWIEKQDKGQLHLNRAANGLLIIDHLRGKEHTHTHTHTHLDKRETVVLQAFAGEADEKAQVVQPIAFGHQDQIDATIREVCVGHDACKFKPQRKRNCQ
eukprot:1158786-Pelagomonas_calceolata.AAC.11